MKNHRIIILILLILLVSLGSNFVFASDNQTSEFSEIAAENDVEMDLTSQTFDGYESNFTQANDEILCEDYEPDTNGIYVSPNGSNKGEGTYQSPYATIAKAISQAKDGKTIYLASGVYKIDSPFSISKNSLTFTSYDGGAPILDGQNKSRIFKLLDNYAFTFSGITFMNGYADNGGVVDFFSLNKFAGTFYNCTFVNNTATGNGGVFYVGRSEVMYSMWDFLYLTSCSFYNNSANVGSIYFGGSNTFSRLEMHYCVAVNNTNYAVYATSNRDGSVSENYWGTNGDISGIVRYNNDYVTGSKLTLISDIEFPTTDDRVIFTAKLISSEGNDYSSAILIPEIPITFTTTSGNLSRSTATITNNKGQSVLTPDGVGDVNVTVCAFGTSITKTLSVSPAPLYVSADAKPGEGNGSFDSPYCLKDAIEAVNNGAVNKIALFEGNYEFNEAYLITSSVTISPYSTPYMLSDVKIISNNGFLNISNGIEVDIYNFTIHNSNSEISPIFNLQSNSKLNIRNLIIKDNSLNSNGQAVIAIVGTESLLNIEYSQITGNNALLHELGEYGYLFSSSGLIIANNNWWGSNDGPSFYEHLVLGNEINASKWFVLSKHQEKQILRTEWTSTFTIQLTDSENNLIEEYLPSLNISFNTNTGELDILEFVLSNENNYFVSNRIAEVTEDAMVSSICDDENVTIEFEYEIPLCEIFISVDGDDENGTGSIDQPFLTISKAITRAKEAGATIYFLNGCYDVSVICNGLYHSNGGGGFNTINNRNITFSSYDGKVIFDRCNSYYVFGFGSNTNISLIDIHFVNSLFTAGSKMGAIRSTGILTIKNCSFDNVSEGGNFAEFIGMDDGGKLYVYNSNFTNICTSGKQYTNAAIRLSGSSAYVYASNCYFANNGYYKTTVDNVTVYQFSNCESCFRTQYGFMEIEDSIFENCSHIAMIYYNGKMNFKGCLFKDNGGAPCLYVSSGGSGFNVDNCTFINNTAGAIGVGLQQYLKDNEINIYNSRFINNSASNGGAIELVRAGAVISNCYFEGNSAVNGGAIYNSYASLLLEHCEFYNNSASNCGGSVYTEGSDDFIDIQYNVFTNSKAGIGGVIYTKGITSLFYNIMKNSTALNGSYIYNDNRVGNVYLNILNNTTVTVYRGMPVTITAFLSDDMANPISGGEIVFKFNNEEISLTSVEGYASFSYAFDEVGSYVIDGNYTGSRRYVVIVGSSIVDVVKKSTELIMPDVDVYYSAVGNVSIILKDNEGNFLNENITLTIGGNEYHLVTENGTAYQEFVLPVGSYSLFVKFDENEDFYSSNASAVVNVLSTIKAYDLTRGYNSGMDFQATLLNTDGSPLSNANVTISVNNKEYKLTSDSNGVIQFNGKLGVGTYYIALVNPISFENVTKKLSVVKRIVLNKNLAMFYMDGSKFKVRIVGNDGKYVGAGVKVTFKIAGLTYTVKTDKYGYASVAIKLLPKKYKITTSYKGFKTTNTVNVKQILKAYNLKVKKTAKQLKVKTLLFKVNNKYLKGKIITLKFVGKTYKVKTNNQGVALFTIDKNIISKLKAGKKYTYTATYIKTTLKKQITVVK